MADRLFTIRASLSEQGGLNVGSGWIESTRIPRVPLHYTARLVRRQHITRTSVQRPFQRRSFGAGDRQQGRGLRILDELLALAHRSHVDAYSVALVFVGLGRHDDAIEWLDRAREARGGVFTAWVSGDARLHVLKSDVRFQTRLQRAGLA